MTDTISYCLTFSTYEKNGTTNETTGTKSFLSLKFNVVEKIGNDNTVAPFKIGETAFPIDFTLKSVNHNRRIGEHNTIVAVLQAQVKGFGTKSNDTKQQSTKETDNLLSPISILKALNDYFQDKSVSWEEYHTTEDQDNKTTDNLYYTFARYYHVLGVTPEFVSYTGPTATEVLNYTFDVTLEILSWDVFLNMAKYSKAYTSKRLGENIISGMVKGLKNTLWTESHADMNILKQTIDTKTIEFRLPYVVQYNETDYNFLLRNANRCGEFLYMTHLGVLTLGNPFLARTQGTADEYKYSGIKAVTRTGTTCYGSTLFCQNAFKETISAASDKPYVAEYANDDYFRSLEKKNYDTEGDWRKLYPDWWSRWLGAILQTKKVDVPTILNVTNQAELSVRSTAKTFSKAAQDKYGKDYFGVTPDNTNTVDSEDRGDTARHAEFSDLYGAKLHNGITLPADCQPSTSNIFKIADSEKSVSRKQYELTYSSLLTTISAPGDKDEVTKRHSNYFIDLGNKIELVGDKLKYVVVKIDSEIKLDAAQKIEKKTVVTLVAADGFAFNNKTTTVPLPANIEPVRKAGAQSAVVVNATDPARLGRVRVRYHWQKDDNDATPWIRVAVPFSTCAPEKSTSADDTGDPGSGMYCTLNKGDEVMVDYESENIERPYVVGSIYGGDQQSGGRKVPFGGRNYSHVFRSRYGHMIGIREPSRATGIVSSFFPAFKMLQVIPTFGTWMDEVSNSDTRRMMGGFDITDAQGFYSITTSTDARKISISSPFGTVGIDAAMGITVSAPNGNIKIEGKNVDIIAGNNLTLKSGANIENSLSARIKANKGLGDWGKKEGKAILKSMLGMFDVPALRFVLEFLVKPVQGSLKVHSNRHLLLEANGEDANISSATFKKIRIPGSANRYSDIKSLLTVITVALSYLKSYKKAYIKKYKEGWQLKNDAKKAVEEVEDRKAALKGVQNEIEQGLENLIGEENLCFDKVKKYLFGDVDISRNVQKKLSVNTILTSVQKATEVSTCIKNESYVPNQSDDWKNVMKGYALFGHFVIFTPGELTNNKKEDVLKFRIDESNDRNSLFDAKINEKIRESLYDIIKKFYLTGGTNHKALIYDGGETTKTQILKNNDNWNKFVNGLHIDNEHGDSHSARDYLNEVGLKIANKLIPFDSFEYLRTWDPNSKGEIVFKDGNNSSFRINNNDFETIDGDDCLGTIKRLLKDPLNASFI